MADGATGSKGRPPNEAPSGRDMPTARSGRLAVFALVRASIPVFAVIGLGYFLGSVRIGGITLGVRSGFFLDRLDWAYTESVAGRHNSRPGGRQGSRQPSFPSLWHIPLRHHRRRARRP